MDWRHRTGQQRFQLLAPLLERLASPIAVSLVQEVEKDDRCRTLPGKQFHPRGSWMNPKLQFLEVEPIVRCDNDFTVENTSSGQLRIQRLEQLGKVSIQRFRIAALNMDFALVAEDQGAKSIPLRFEDPGLAGWQFLNSLREHRQYRRVHWKLHGFTLLPRRERTNAEGRIRTLCDPAFTLVELGHHGNRGSGFMSVATTAERLENAIVR